MGSQVKELRINGVDVLRPSSYLPHVHKYYTAEIERNKRGQILSFPRKFYRPWFEATWDRMSIEEFSNLHNTAYTTDTVNIEWWNPLTRQYETREFAVETLEPERLVDKGGDFVEWENVRMVAVQTNNMVIAATIIFNANGGSGNMNNLNGFFRDEYRVPASTFAAPAGMVFNGWNTEPDGSGSAFVIGQRRALMFESLTLFAQWVRA